MSIDHACIMVCFSTLLANATNKHLVYLLLGVRESVPNLSGRHQLLYTVAGGSITRTSE